MPSTTQAATASVTASKPCTRTQALSTGAPPSQQGRRLRGRKRGRARDRARPRRPVRAAPRVSPSDVQETLPTCSRYRLTFRTTVSPSASRTPDSATGIQSLSGASTQALSRCALTSQDSTPAKMQLELGSGLQDASAPSTSSCPLLSSNPRPGGCGIETHRVIPTSPTGCQCDALGHAAAGPPGTAALAATVTQDQPATPTRTQTHARRRATRTNVHGLQIR